MILPAQTIAALSEGEFPMIEPFLPEQRYFNQEQKKGNVLTLSFGLGPASYDVRLENEVVSPPRSFRLGVTTEFFRIPSSILAVVHDKSTWARLGIAVQNTILDPGFRGFVTLEITNHGEQTWHFQPGTPIAQIVFHQLSAPTDRPYSGKYQNQGPKPEEAR